MPNSNSKPHPRKSGTLTKPKKPHAKFPLTPHATGEWLKKIGGKIHYFVFSSLENVDNWRLAADSTSLLGITRRSLLAGNRGSADFL